MTPSRAFRIVHLAGGRAVAVVVLLAVLARGTVARADSIEDLIQQLTGGSDKERLAAAVNLTKLGDPRAIKPLTLVLLRGDSEDDTVRSAAAVGLGKLVNDRIPPAQKQAAISALKQAANDASALVRSQAEKALKAIDVAVPVPTSAAIYVNIGPMSSKTGDSSSDAKLQGLMVRVATKTMGKVAKGMSTNWPGGAPTKAGLDAKGAQGFYVDGTLNELKVKEAGSSTMVSCKINMLLASYPDKSIFAFLNGGASVQASGSSKDIALAREDCVSAVVEDLIAKKIVPTINTKAGSP
jgi:hypothetical protein